jgi:hypothetical protein
MVLARRQSRPDGDRLVSDPDDLGSDTDGDLIGRLAVDG